MKKFQQIYPFYQENQSLILASLNQNQIQTSQFQGNLLSSIILIHTINLSDGLTSINQNDQDCLFDLSSFKGNQGVFKTRYRHGKKQTQNTKDKIENNSKNKTENNHKNQNQKQAIILFRFVINSNQMSVNFCVQGDDHLYQVLISQSDDQKVVYQKYYKQFNHFSKIIEKQDSSTNIASKTILRPVPLVQNPYNQPDYGNFPLYVPQMPSNQPINNPFGRDQYVGPNSSIFKDRFDPQNRYPNNLGKIPIGSRYDPVDPFDNMGESNNSPNNQFFGFDQFGNPIKKQSPYNLQRRSPGNGGGFGGNRGGFGGNRGGFGGFGGNIGGFGNNQFL